MTKNIRLAIRISAVLAVVVGYWLYFLFSSIVKEEKGVVYYLRPGTSKSVMMREMAQQGIIKHPWLFALYLSPYTSEQLRAGEYRFPKGSTPRSIWRQVSTGTGQVYHVFTIIPGWTFAQVRTKLNNDPYIRHVSTMMDDKQIMRTLGEYNRLPEGNFMPESYYFTRDTVDLVLLKRAYDLMQSSLIEAWNKRDKSIPYRTAYDALIAASLVEKEAKLAQDRPKIAGVIMNRLNKDMLLQIDPTVIYGLGSRYDGKIYKKDLHENTPYNTYVRKGLPPTPIAMPGLAAIEAVMHPEHHQYLYFVAKADGSGGHEFTANLDAHHQAVANAAARKVSAPFFNAYKMQQYVLTYINHGLLSGEALLTPSLSTTSMKMHDAR